MTKPNPVIAVLLIGLTPMSPTIEVVPVVEIPDFDRITKSSAVPRFTGARVAPVVLVELELEDIIVELMVVGLLVLVVEREVVEVVEVVEVGCDVVELETDVVVDPVADVVLDVVIDVVTVVVVTLVVVAGIVDVLDALVARVAVEEAVVARVIDLVVVVTVVF